MVAGNITTSVYKGRRANEQSTYLDVYVLSSCPKDIQLCTVVLNVLDGVASFVCTKLDLDIKGLNPARKVKLTYQSITSECSVS